MNNHDSDYDHATTPTTTNTEEGREWPDKPRPRTRCAQRQKMYTGTPKTDTGKLANLIEFDKEAHDKIPKEHGTERSN